MMRPLGLTILAACSGAALHGTGWEEARPFEIANPTGQALTIVLTGFEAKAVGRVGWRGLGRIGELRPAGAGPPFAPDACFPLGAGATQGILLDNPGRLSRVEAQFLILDARLAQVAQFRIRLEGKWGVCACTGFTAGPGWGGVAMGPRLTLGLAAGQTGRTSPGAGSSAPAGTPWPIPGEDVDMVPAARAAGSASSSSSGTSSHSSADAAVAVKPDPGARILSDQAILAEIAVLTQGMDLSQPLANCGRLSLALLDFLETGESKGGPVSTEPVEDPESSEWNYYRRSFRIKQEDGSSQPRRMRYARYDVEGNEDGRFEPPAGFLETDQGWAEWLDASATTTRPLHLEWRKVARLIARELERVDQVGGTLAASRVNKHALEEMHEIVFDAYREGSGHRIRYLDAQDAEQPIRERLEEVFEFVASTDADAVHGDSFAPEVALKIAYRRRAPAALDPAPPASIPPGGAAPMEDDESGPKAKARTQVKRKRDDGSEEPPRPGPKDQPASSSPGAKRPRTTEGAEWLTEAERAFLAGGVSRAEARYKNGNAPLVSVESLDRATGATTFHAMASEAARRYEVSLSEIKRRLDRDPRREETFLVRYAKAKPPSLDLTEQEKAFLAGGASREKAGAKQRAVTIRDRGTDAATTWATIKAAAQRLGCSTATISNRLKKGPHPSDTFLVRYAETPPPPSLDLTEEERAFLAGGASQAEAQHKRGNVTAAAVESRDRATGATTVHATVTEAAQRLGLNWNSLQMRLDLGPRGEDAFLVRYVKAPPPPWTVSPGAKRPRTTEGAGAGAEWLTEAEQAFLAEGVSREKAGPVGRCAVMIRDRGTGATTTWPTLRAAAQRLGCSLAKLRKRLNNGPHPDDAFLARYAETPR